MILLSLRARHNQPTLAVGSRRTRSTAVAVAVNAVWTRERVAAYTNRYGVTRPRSKGNFRTRVCGRVAPPGARVDAHIPPPFRAPRGTSSRIPRQYQSSRGPSTVDVCHASSVPSLLSSPSPPFSSPRHCVPTRLLTLDRITALSYNTPQSFYQRSRRSWVYTTSNRVLAITVTGVSAVVRDSAMRSGP